MPQQKTPRLATENHRLTKRLLKLESERAEFVRALTALVDLVEKPHMLAAGEGSGPWKSWMRKRNRVLENLSKVIGGVKGR